MGANVTGPLTIRSSGSGGVISGDVQLVRSRFTLGKANAVAEIPELKVIEINRRGEIEEDEATAPSPWRLNVHARARNRLVVTGLGLEIGRAACRERGGQYG